jgi:hypothetical protein
LNAEAHFRQALTIWGRDPLSEAGDGIDFAARPIAQQCLRWLTAAGR